MCCESHQSVMLCMLLPAANSTQDIKKFGTTVFAEGVAAYKAAEAGALVAAAWGGCACVYDAGGGGVCAAPLTFSSLTGHKVITSLWSQVSAMARMLGDCFGLNEQGQIEHIAERRQRMRW